VNAGPRGQDARPLPMPPQSRIETEDGDMRRVGVELEFSGLEIADAASLVADFIDGSVFDDTDYEKEIRGDDRGSWGVEVDFELLKSMGRKQEEDGEDGEAQQSALDELVEEVVRRSSAVVVPLEVVSPPIPMDQLGELNPLIEALRQAGAEGTSDSWAYAFGMHLNPELPGTDAGTILSYMKAFFCLFDWMVEESEIDLTRRITPYIAPFPKDYVEQVVDPAYQPELSALIDDYLDANPTRNRVLDMLPLFAHLDSARVSESVSDPRIKSRPTLHYRLPDCEIGRENWDLSEAWMIWLQVEYLAADTRRLDDLCSRYHQHLREASAVFPSAWSIDPDVDLASID
jgi:hypothetical protein